MTTQQQAAISAEAKKIIKTSAYFFEYPDAIQEMLEQMATFALSLIPQPSEQPNVVICQNCKRFHIEGVEQCACGSKMFARTHKSNAAFIESEPQPSGTRFVNIYNDPEGDRFISDEDYDTYDEAFKGRDVLSSYVETVSINATPPAQPSADIQADAERRYPYPESVLKSDWYYLECEKIDRERAAYTLGRMQQSGWVSVEDRLPEDGKVVIVYCPRYDHAITSYRYSGHWQELVNGYEYFTHWQPLPPSPVIDNDKK